MRYDLVQHHRLRAPRSVGEAGGQEANDDRHLGARAPRAQGAARDVGGEHGAGEGRGGDDGARAGDERQATLAALCQAFGAVAGQHRAVGAAVHADAHVAFGVAHERFGVGALHAREVVDVLLAQRAEAGAIVAAHGVPVGLAGGGDAKTLEREPLAQRFEPFDELGPLGFEPAAIGSRRGRPVESAVIGVWCGRPLGGVGLT
jgi:hypothetical protein